MPRSRALTRSLAAAASLFLVANSVAIVHVAARDPVTEQPEILRATTDGAHLYDVGLRSRGHGNVTDAHRSIPGNDTGDVVEPAVKMENPTSIHAAAMTLTAPEPLPATINDTAPATIHSLTVISSGDLPPSPIAAVGLDHLAFANTGRITFLRRNQSSGIEVTYRNLFLLSDDVQNHDPRLYYDAAHGRWVAAEGSLDCSANGATYGLGYLDFAISDGPDPTKGWSSYYYTYVDQVPTEIGLGNSRDAFVLTTSVKQMIDSDCLLEENHGNEVYSFDWADVVAGAGFDATYWSYLGGAIWFRILVPALAFPATDPKAHLVTVLFRNGTNEVVHQTVDAATGIIHSEFLTADGAVRAMLGPPPIPQGVGAQDLKVREFGATSVVWQRSRLVFGSNDRCTPEGDASIRACARVTELDTSTSPATLAQDFMDGTMGVDTYAPGIALTAIGDLHLSDTRSSTSIVPSTYATRQRAADTANSLSVATRIHEGFAWVNPRFSDYLQLAPDPLVPDSAWIFDHNGSTDQPAELTTATGDTYTALDPVRILDTRNGTGLNGKFTANVPRTFNVAGAAGGLIPANAVAVTGNVTVANQTAAGYLALGPISTAYPTSSTINFPLGDIRGNNFTLPLDGSGDLAAVYKAPAGKTAHVIVDITGYFFEDGSAATYHPVTSARILDSRAGKSIGLSGRFNANVPRSFGVTGHGGVPAGAIAVTGNLTVTNQTRAGYVSLGPVSDATPETSSLNFPLGDNRGNGITVALSDTGRLWGVYKAGSGTADLIFDVTGYYTADATGLRFFALNPARIMDTRYSALTQLFGKFISSTPRTLHTGGHFGVPGNALAVAGNLSVVGQSQAGYVAITLTPNPTPPNSSLNFPYGDIRGNGVTVPLNGSNDMAIVYKAGTGATTHLILDLTGYFR